MTLVSACLLGLNCRYDGQRREIPVKIKNLIEEGECLIPVCPEQLGGLPTPRAKSILNWDEGKPVVINSDGKDVTEEFVRGGEETLKTAKMFNADRVIFKSRSPSCGYDGVTTRKLKEGGFEVEILEAPSHSPSR